MQPLINLVFFLLLLSSHTACTQRMTFHDPDLTFSFKKPKKWEVFDDGLVVKTSPSAADTAHIYFSITYYEDAQPYGEFSLEQVILDTPPKDDLPYSKKIAGESSKYVVHIDGNLKKSTYQFYKLGQRFEVTINQPFPEDREVNKTLGRILRTIKVEGRKN